VQGVLEVLLSNVNDFLQRKLIQMPEVDEILLMIFFITLDFLNKLSHQFLRQLVSHICYYQRLSHASVSIGIFLQRNCG
jgi:hypothetical protein